MVDDVKQAGARIRAWRNGQDPNWSLDRLCDAIGEQTGKRPSTAKLSRIETGQPTPRDILPALSRITGLSFDELRPDLVALRQEAVGG